MSWVPLQTLGMKAGWQPRLPQGIDHQFGSIQAAITLVLIASAFLCFQHGDALVVPLLPFPFIALHLFASLLSSSRQGGVLLTTMSAVSAFAVTNIDDILLLVLLFSQVTSRWRALAIVVGQLLGISLLVLVSLGGLVGQALFPRPWLGLLGLIPISLAVSQWRRSTSADSAPIGSDLGASFPTAEEPSILAVAILTVANGSDNLGVYLPMFAHASPAQSVVILMVFTAMVGLWCALAWRLAHAPALGALLQRHGPRLMPVVLIGLGFILLHQAETLSHRGLALISLLCLAAMALPLAQSPSSPLPRHDSILPSIAAFTAAVRSPEPDSSLPSAR